MGLTAEPCTDSICFRKPPSLNDGHRSPASSPHLPYRRALHLQADLLPPPGPAGPGLFEDLPAPAQLTMPRHSSAALPGASAQLALPPPPPHAVYGSSAHALGPGAGTFLSPGPPVGLDAAGWRGRITFYCIAESFDRKKAEELLRRTYPPGAVRSFPDAFHVEYIKWVNGAGWRAWGTSVERRANRRSQAKRILHCMHATGAFSGPRSKARSGGSVCAPYTSPGPHVVGCRQCVRV